MENKLNEKKVELEVFDFDKYEEEKRFTPEEQEEFNITEFGDDKDGYDTWCHCQWCEEAYPEAECVKELQMGWLCPQCEAALYSRGEKLAIVEGECHHHEHEDELIEDKELKAEDSYNFDGIVYIPSNELGRWTREFGPEELKEHNGFVEVKGHRTFNWEECWPDLELGEREVTAAKHHSRSIDGVTYVETTCILVNYDDLDRFINEEDIIKISPKSKKVQIDVKDKSKVGEDGHPIQKGLKGPLKVHEGMTAEYYCLSDGKNPRRSRIYPVGSFKLEDLIATLNDECKKLKPGEHWELLHYKDGDGKVVWTSEECELSEASTAERRAAKYGMEAATDLVQGKAIARIKDPKARDAAIAAVKAGRPEVAKQFYGGRKEQQADAALDKKVAKMQKAGFDLEEDADKLTESSWVIKSTVLKDGSHLSVAWEKDQGFYVTCSHDPYKDSTGATIYRTKFRNHYNEKDDAVKAYDEIVAKDGFPTDKSIEEELVSDAEAFWNMRNETSKIAENKYDEVNLILDGDTIRPVEKSELANKFAVSIEHADREDYKSKDELEKIASEVGAERIMFFVYKGQYGGEYSFLVNDEETAKKLAKEYTQKSYAKYDENGNYQEVTITEESLEEGKSTYRVEWSTPEDNFSKEFKTYQKALDFFTEIRDGDKFWSTIEMYKLGDKKPELLAVEEKSNDTIRKHLGEDLTKSLIDNIKGEVDKSGHDFIIYKPDGYIAYSIEFTKDGEDYVASKYKSTESGMGDTDPEEVFRSPNFREVIKYLLINNYFDDEGSDISNEEAESYLKVTTTEALKMPFRQFIIYDKDDEIMKKFDNEKEAVEFIKGNEDAAALYIKEMNSQETGFSKTPKYATYLFWEKGSDSEAKLDSLIESLKEASLKEYTTYYFGEDEYPNRAEDWGEYDPHTCKFANGKTLDDIPMEDRFDPEEEIHEDVTKELKIQNNENIIEDERKLSPPIDTEYFPNKMGINLCSVKKEKWTEQDDGQLKKIEIEFDPATEKEKKEQGQIEEDIEKHTELNPILFDGTELKPEIKEAVQRVVDEFVEDITDDDIKLDVKDIVIVGSNVNYNYTKDSDIDVHIIVDSSVLDCPKEIVDKLYGAYRSIFNKNYDINIKGIPVEIYVELDNIDSLKSNGIYSLKSGWIKEPVQQDIPDLDNDAFEKLFSEWEDRYEALKEKENLTSEEVKQFINDIYELRKTGISAGGEFDLGNLVFKEFRNLGYLDLLKDLRKELKGKELSLESLNK